MYTYLTPSGKVVTVRTWKEYKNMNTEQTEEVVKLTKKALNEFIGWTTSRYNNYLGFGTKKQNVDTVYNSLINGFFTNERGKQDEAKTIFEIQCASPVGENYHYKSGGGGSKPLHWKTKQSGDEYIIDCINKTIVAKYSKRTIKFNLVG
jgi:hypothetical protein